MGGDVDRAVTKLQTLVRIPTVSYRDWDAIDVASFDGFVEELRAQFPLVHEHLELGIGQVDFVAALRALTDIGYRGLAALELPRQGHDAPAVAERSLSFLRAAEARTRARTRRKEMAG